MSKELRIYLAGRCKGLDDGGKTWRKKITDRLKNLIDDHNNKVYIFDPTEYFDYNEKTYQSQKQIKDFYYYNLRNSDIMILNANDSAESIGTAMEVQFAVDNGIPVLAFGTENTYPWIVEVDAQVVFDTLEEVVDYVRDYYTR